MSEQPPLIVHVIHHLVVGGLENGLVNLVNRLPAQRYRHAIVCMDDYSDFRTRIKRDDVQVHAMRRNRAGHVKTFLRLLQLFKSLRPSIVHSRNLSGLDSLLPSLLAGVPFRMHGEHGRDVDEQYGNNRKPHRLRRLHRPMVSHYTCVSKDLERYLVEQVGVPPARVTQIYNGTDTDAFRPNTSGRAQPEAWPWSGSERFVVGTVGRLQPIKNQIFLARAVSAVLRRHPTIRERLGLVIVGDGPQRAEIAEFIQAEKMGDCTWLAGARDDIPAVLPQFDAFILPSLSEGISNTILEAMACGLPVIATDVGGNPELVLEGVTGRLVPSGNIAALADAVFELLTNRDFALACGRNARARAVESFSISAMVNRYDTLYQRAISGSLLETTPA